MTATKRADSLALVARAMTEARLQRQVLRLAHDLHWATYHPAVSQYSAPGWPDLVLASPQQGRLLYRELKRESGTVTEPQRRWLDILTRSGADAGVWRPSDLLAGTIARELSHHGLAGPGAVPRV